MSVLTFRVKTKNGQHVLKELTAQSTLLDLLTSISKLTSVQPQAIKILCGFPPKPLVQSDVTRSLEDLKMRSGDTLIVEEDASVKEEKRNEWMQHMQMQLQSAEGFLAREVVPANNSCLFTSVNYVMTGHLNLESAPSLRQLIARVVSSDHKTYTEVFLGKPNAEYCAWILDDQTWGGAIEVSILCKYYSVEIDVVDTQSIRIDRFGEDQNYEKRVLLIYDGIHYDPLKLESVHPGVSPITKFSTQDSAILAQALQLAAEAKSSRQFTDVAGFSLRCLICNKTLKGQTEAQNHAATTGHINFGEV
ncbi:hypothetical protein CAPTEDRAFT_154633 [Capitella teleta]|uniref:Ubiquitin thioesterase OTU n=1 Tax=Capitella teleta TaxID=283909 RepID=R7TPT9_CAPTE|nr:hypothetical protein CAPTEDRAFT_154633 [Capitella teleta]|eukprot:ELT95674.1 hypothetical protein CAPTEDRAFT_154633 [Capitella teleta]